MPLKGSKTQKSASRNLILTEIIATKTNHDHMDLEKSEEWSKSPRKKSFFKPDFKERDYTQLY